MPSPSIGEIEMRDANYHRLAIMIPKELYKRLNGQFEWGERNRVMNHILEWTCDMMEKHGKDALAVFLRKGSLSHLALKELQEKEDGTNS